MHILTFREYTDLALRTLSYEFPEDTWQYHMPVKLRDFTHAIVGLQTELSELCAAFDSVDLKNQREEVSDMWWYMAVLYHTLRGDQFNENVIQMAVDRVQFVARTPTSLTNNMFSLAGEAFDIAKRRIWYMADDFDPKSSYSLVNIPEMLIALVRLTIEVYRSVGNNTTRYDINRFAIDSIQNAWSDNIIKLQKRFPSKFTQSAALNRDVDHELSHIDSEGAEINGKEF